MKKDKILNIIALFLASILICLSSYRIYEYMFLDDDIDINENENDNDNDNDVNNKLKLDFVKSLNTSNITYTNPTEADLNIGLSVNLNADNKSITLSIDWKLFCNYGYEKIC